MNRLNILFFVSSLFLVLAAHAQTKTSSPFTKNTKTLVRAHRGTLVTNSKEKVSKTAHLRYAGLPRIGSEIVAVPAGAIIAGDSLHSYYYKSGIFYVQNKTGFVITLPVPGTQLKGLPIGYRRVPVGENVYFYYYGTFYRQLKDADNYEVVSAPETAIVDGLPNGYSIRKIDGTEYYFLNGVYYAEINVPAMENGTGYEVVTIIETY